MSCFNKCFSILTNGNDDGHDFEGYDRNPVSSTWAPVGSHLTKYDLASSAEGDDHSPSLGPIADQGELIRRLKRYEDIEFLRNENKNLRLKVSHLEKQLALARGEPVPTSSDDNGDSSALDKPLIDEQPLEHKTNHVDPDVVDVGLPPLALSVGLPPPVLSEDQQLQADVDQCKIKLVELVSQSKTCGFSWTNSKEKGGITLSTCQIPGTNSLGVKVVSTFDMSADITFETIMHKDTKLDDGGSSKYTVLMEIGDNYKLTHTRVSVPLFSDSDFCCGEWSGTHPDPYHDKDASAYVFTSVTHSKCKPQKGSIRGKIIVGGWYVVPMGPSQCEVTMISVCDPKRSLPSALAQSTAEKSGKSMSILRKLVVQRLEVQRASSHTHVQNGTI